VCQNRTENAMTLIATLIPASGGWGLEQSRIQAKAYGWNISKNYPQPLPSHTLDISAHLWLIWPFTGVKLDTYWLL
jgi:hypothetical protein